MQGMRFVALVCVCVGPHRAAAAEADVRAALSRPILAPHRTLVEIQRYGGTFQLVELPDGDVTPLRMPDYFRTLGVPVQRGREFTMAEESATEAAPVAIVDIGLANRLWPGENPNCFAIRDASPRCC